MNPLGTRGAADFACALDGGTAGTLPGLALAARLRTVGSSLDHAVAPRAEFRDALRMRLMAVATVQATTPPLTAVPLSSAVSWRRRTGSVAAGALAAVVAVSGVAVAGSQSLPGDPFYGVKKTAEAFQLRTADGDVEKGAQHLEFAATRLREVRGLSLGRDAVDGAGLAATAPAAVEPEVVARVRQTLAEMDEQTLEGSALLNEAFRSSRTPEPLRVLGTFTERQAAGLQELLPVLPQRTQDRARISLALLSDVSAETEELLAMGTCTNGCDPTQAAPTLPAGPGAPPGSSTVPCDCGAPAPAPAPAPTAPSSAGEEPAAEPAAEPTSEPTSPPAPQPSSPAPSPSPSSGLPLPLPVPVPSLPVPVPTLTLAPLAPLAPVVETLLPGTSGNSTSGSSPAPAAPAPAPPPVVAPVVPRP